ncbi:hypothetical protein [Micromonospora sp. NPDC005174]|uniref:hypothetical protein n=1 Tax=Micromonospora sp. NPDC005174 TaxID=3157018 RepID=UPI0033A63307
MCTPSQEDSQAIRRADAEKDELEKIVRRRQKATAPAVYRYLAMLTGSAAIVVWTIILVDCLDDPGADIGRAYGSFLALGGACALAAVATLLSWLRERDAAQHRAEVDRIREDQHRRQVKAIREVTRLAFAGELVDDGDVRGLDPEVIELGRRLNQKVNGSQQGWNRAR